MSDELEQCRVQLAGCSVVALGSKDRPKKGDYGWSASLQDVADLYDRAEAAEALVRKKDARIAELEGALQQADFTLNSVMVFVNSKERIKQPEGRDWFAEQHAKVKSVLSAAEAKARETADDR